MDDPLLQKSKPLGQRILVKNALVCLETIILRSMGADEPPGDAAVRRTRRKLACCPSFLNFWEWKCVRMFRVWLRNCGSCRGRHLDAVFFRLAGTIPDSDAHVKVHCSGNEFPESWYGDGGGHTRGLMLEDMEHRKYPPVHDSEDLSDKDFDECFLKPDRLSDKHGWAAWHWKGWQDHKGLVDGLKKICCYGKCNWRNGVIKGQLSPTFPITLTWDMRTAYRIPEKATHFCFSYPLQDVEWKETDEESIELKFLKRGGYLYFEKVQTDPNLCRMILSSTAFVARFFEWSIGCCEPIVLSPFKLVKIRVFTEIAHHPTPAMYMGVPHWLEPHQCWKQWSMKRPVTNKHLKDRNAEYFCWVSPSDSLGNEICPLGYPHGGFLYFGNFKDKEHAIRGLKEEKDKETNELTADWLKAHAAAFQEVIEEEADYAKEFRVRQVGVLAQHLATLKPDVKDDRQTIKQRMEDIIKVRSGLKVSISQGIGLRVYFTGLWVRFPFFFLNLTFLLIGGSAGAVMTILFTVLGAGLGEKDALTSRSVILFLFLPFLTVILAGIVDQLADLIMDSVAYPYFVKLRATLITAYCAVFRCNKPTPTVLALVDILVFFGLELLPMSGLLYNMWNFQSLGTIPALFYRGHQGITNAAVAGYVTGLLYMCVLFAFVFTIADVIIGMIEWNRTPDTSLDFFETRVKSTIKAQDIVPMSLWWRSHCFDFMDEHPTFVKHQDSRQPKVCRTFSAPARVGDRPTRSAIWIYHELHSTLKQFEITIGIETLCCTLWVVLGFIFQTFFSESVPFAFVMMLTWITVTAAISLKLHNEFPKLIGGTYVGVLVFMGFLVFGLIFVQRSQDKMMINNNNEVLQPMMVVELPYSGPSPRPAIQPVTGDDLPRWWKMPGHTVKYPICRRTWGSESAPVGALDLAALSWLAYEVESENIESLLPVHFGDRNVTFLNGTHYEQIPRWFAVRFHAQPRVDNTESEYQDTVVIAVKGTSTLSDTYLDTALFTSIKVLQVFNFIAPVLVSLPTDMVQWLLSQFKLFVGETPAFKVFDELADRVIDMMNEPRFANSRFVLTGHSLGGGIAEVVAAKVGIEALVWSAPGTLYTERYFNITEEEVQRDVTVVVPDRDVVPRVDSHEAAVQMIQCYLKNHQVPGPEDSAVCHSIVKSACEIWRVCGDPKERNFTAACSQYVNKTELGRPYPQRDHPIWDKFDDR